MQRAGIPPSPDLRPLLLRAAAPFADLAAEGRAALLSAAARHGLLSTLEGRLPKEDVALRQRFDRLAAGARLRDALLRNALEEVLAVLAAAGIIPVALKGPALADRLYPDPSLRPAGDLDLLVAVPQLEPAAAALAKVGFHRGPPLVEAYQRRHHHHLHLQRPSGPPVELHFRPQSGFGAALPQGPLLDRAVPHRTPRGTPLRVLAPEDELLVLAVHAAGHQLERAGWLLDLLLFLEHHPDLDWSELSRRARAYRCARPLAYALGRVQALGAAVPAAPLAPLGSRRRKACDRLALAALSSPGRKGGALRLSFDLALRDRSFTAPALLLREAYWFMRRRVRLPRPLPRRPARGPGPAMEGDGRLLAPFWQPVRGGSMRPALREGDEVLLGPAAELAVGDVVVVRLPGRPGTFLHRLLEVDAARVLTRGDACALLDPPAPRTAVLFRALARWRAGAETPVPPPEAKRADGVDEGEAAR